MPPANQRRQPQQQMRQNVSSMGHGHATAAARPEYTMAPPMMHGNSANHAPRNPIGQVIPQHSGAHEGASRTPTPTQHAANRPSTHAEATQQPSQEQAVRQFRRANKGLPDGVRYEPLDENTMRLLRENGHLPPAEPTQQTQAPAPSTVQAPEPLVPVQPAITGLTSPQPMTATPLPSAAPPDSLSIVKVIEGLVQDERNAHVFYSHLAKTAQGNASEPALTEIANDSSQHAAKFTQILARQFGSNFTPVEAEINTGLELTNALALALEEENKSLRILAELLEGVANTESEKIIQRIINKKVVNYNQLERLYAHS